MMCSNKMYVKINKESRKLETVARKSAQRVNKNDTARNTYDLRLQTFLSQTVEVCII